LKDPQARTDKLASLVKVIFAAQADDITCDDCFEHIDTYVDMLLSGEDPGTVLPQVKTHLEQCHCCETELQALITILEAGADQPPLPGE
jgi:hypothetical protein